MKSLDKSNENTEFYLKVISISLVIIAAIAVTTTLMYLKAVMVPFVLALFLYFMVSPLVDRLEDNLKIHRGVSVVLTLVLAGLMAVMIVAIVSASLRSFFESAPLYQQRLATAMNEFETLLRGWGFGGFEMGQLRKQIETARVLSMVQKFSGQFMGIVGNFFLISVFLIFLLLGQARAGHMPAYMNTVIGQISKYIWTKFVLSLATGLIVGLFFAILGLDLAFMFGVLAFLLNFIPSIGSIIATLLPIPVALLQFGVGGHLAMALIVPMVVQISIGNVIEPKLLGKSLGLHPVTLLFFLVFWGIVWGVPGMFLAVPITAIMKFVFSSFSGTRSLANLMAGEPFSGE